MSYRNRQQLCGDALNVSDAPEGEADGGGSVSSSSAGGSADDQQMGGDEDMPQDLDTLQNVLRKERKRNAEMARRQMRLDAQMAELQGLDPEKFREAMARAEEAAKRREEVEATSRAKLAQLEQQHAARLKALQAELEQERTSRERDGTKNLIERHFNANRGRQAVAEDGRSAYDSFWLEFGDRFRRDEKGRPYVADADGDPVMDEETGQRLTVEKFMEKLRRDPLYSVHFEPEYGTGSGGRSGRDGRADGGKVDLSRSGRRASFAQVFGSR